MSKEDAKNLIEELNSVKKRVRKIENKIKKIPKVEESQIGQILQALEEIRESRKDNTWKLIGYFLLGGISFIFILYIIAITLT